MSKKRASPARSRQIEKQSASSPKPWVAAAFNFILWGAGYIYNKKRTGFGTLLLVGYILSIASLLFFPETIIANAGFMYNLLSILAYFFMSAAFAIDAYRDAKR